ncbi:MAG: nucleoside phosphorylase [Synergistaceae bacterium]|jgi:uridine phosphorylase|nr:nucleoside phosphorylase [Synergistaceae bacterium]
MSGWKFYDPSPDAVINPSGRHAPMEGFPPLVVSAFSEKLARKVVDARNPRKITDLDTSHSDIPVYALTFGGAEVAFFTSPIGAPFCTAIFERIIAFGGRSFVYFGSCGTLDAEIAESSFIVPTAAVRDEGTSRHYCPPGEEIELDAGCVRAVSGAMAELGCKYVEAKTWTTDAIYRETRAKMEEAKRRGCVSVEMECAALAAAARFRGVRFAQFLYAADNLDAPKWEARNLKDHGVSGGEKCLEIALKSVLSMA